MGGVTVFSGSATAGNAIINTHGSASGAGGVTRFLDFAGGGNATAITGLNGTFDISGLSALGMGIGSIAGAGNYVLGSKQFLVGSNNTSTIVSGLISGDGGALRKTGNGSLTLLGANTYSGFTSIFDGSIIAANTAGSATGPGTVFVMAGGTLAGGNPTGTSGFIAGPVSVAPGGRIAPGLTDPSAGLLTLLSDLSLNATSRLEFQLLTPDLFSAPDNDRLSVAGDLLLAASSTSTPRSDLGDWVRIGFSHTVETSRTTGFPWARFPPASIRVTSWSMSRSQER
jgi:autotransporter-associated beta strand protein